MLQIYITGYNTLFLFVFSAVVYGVVCPHRFMLYASVSSVHRLFRDLSWSSSGDGRCLHQQRSFSHVLLLQMHLIWLSWWILYCTMALSYGIIFQCSTGPLWSRFACGDVPDA